MAAAAAASATSTVTSAVVSAETAPKSIAFLGLGLMGTELVKNMAASPRLAGSTIAIWNRTKAKADSVASQISSPSASVVVASTADEAAARSEFVVLMLFDFPSTVETLASISSLEGKVIVNHATISPPQSKQLRDDVAKRGGVFVECPLLGNPTAVANKKAKFMIGFDDDNNNNKDVVARVAASIDVSGEVLRIGQVGSASALKLSLNNLIASQLAAFSTSFAIVSQNGISQDTFLHLVQNSVLAFPYFPSWAKRFSEQSYGGALSFSLDGIIKDSSLVVDLAKESGVDAFSTQGALQIFERAKERGLEGDISSAYEGVFAQPRK